MIAECLPEQGFAAQHATTGIFPWKRFEAHTRIVGSLTSAIITISPGMASCTAAGRRTRSGHTPRAGTITVWVFATRADWMSEVFPLIPAPTPSVVPCSISCGSYAVITRQRISWDITNSAPISARLAPASTRRKNMRNCIRLRDI